VTRRPSWVILTERSINGAIRKDSSRSPERDPFDRELHTTK